MFDCFQKTTTDYPLFPNVTEINLEFHENWPLLSLQSLSIFIDISRIVHMKICTDYFNEYNENTWMDIGIFMEQAHNLSLLIIQLNFNLYFSGRITKNIYSILPRHVKHLKIPIGDLEHIKMIFERCKNLSTIKFYYGDVKLYKKVTRWFSDNTSNTTCQESYRRVSVWFGKKKIQLNEVSVHHKRIKLTSNN